jgi:tetratricopeptide (TPR) repeat protein
MVKHAFDPARKIELLHTIGELYEVGGDDGDKAFDTYARALHEDPANAETQGRLDRLARTLSKFPAYVQLLDDVVKHVQDDELKITLLSKVAQLHEIELEKDEDAVKTHARILEVDPKNLVAATAIQTIHARNSDYPRLVDALKKRAEIELNLDQKKGFLYQAAQIEEEVLENADAAIATFQLVLGLDEIDPHAMDSLERLYIRLERWNPLKDIYAKKVEHAASPEDRKQMLFVLGQVYDRELGDVAKAIETYQQILDLDEEDLTAIQQLDRLYGQAARWYDLLGILEREVNLSGSTGETVALKHRIGQLWEKELKDLTRAIEAYREATDLDPGFEPTIAALDGLLHKEGEPVLAAQVLEPIYDRAVEFEKLIDVYEVMNAHAEDPPRHVELLHKIAELYERRLEKHTAAFEAYGRALRFDQANEQTLTNLERLADTTRAWEPLARLYDEELKKLLDVPRQVDLLLRLARVYEEELAKTDKAIETFRRVLDADGDNRVAIAALDRLYEHTGNWADLTKILRTEIRLAASDQEILATEFRLGQVFEQNLKDLPAAIDVYSEILKQDRAHSPTLNALELLFLEGHHQIEIGAILEPLYSDAQQWEKLHKINEVQLEKISDPNERLAMHQRLAELSEQRISDPHRAFRWWGAAFGEDPRNERAGEELERLAKDTQAWPDLVVIYTDVLARRQDKDIQRAVLLKVGRVYDAEVHDATHAEEMYLRVLGIDAKDPSALEALDRIYEAGGMYHELADVLRRRVEIADSIDDKILLYFRLGMVFSDVLAQLDDAIKCYEKILEDDTRNRDALQSLERIYFRREDWKALHGVYTKLLDTAKSDEERGDIHAHLARLDSEALDDDASAVEEWTKVIEFRGEDAIALTGLGDLHERKEEWRDLVEILDRLVRCYDQPADKIAIYKRLGKVWSEKLGRERNSLESWLNAYHLDERDLETLRALAILYRATQAWEELSSTLQQVIAVAQTQEGTGGVDEHELIELLAQLSQLEGEVLGRTNEAVDAWRKVLALEPGDLRALAALEQLFVREGRWEECIDVL